MKYGVEVEIFILFFYVIKDEPEARPKTTEFEAGGEGMDNKWMEGVTEVQSFRCNNRCL